MSLPKNASILATKAETERLEKSFAGDPDISHFSSYVGGGAIRFYLPLDVQLDNDFMTEVVVVATDLDARDRVQTRLATLFVKDFPDAIVRISRLELGPPVGWPVQYRVSAPTIKEARHYADQVADLLRSSNLVRNVNYNWAEKSKQLRINVDQDRVRQAGLSSEQLAQTLNRVITGSTVTHVRDSIYLIDVVARAESGERSSIEALRNLQITTPAGASVPLRELATFHYELDEGYVWRRGRLPTITVQAEPLPGLEPASVDQRISGALEAVRKAMPAGTLLEIGGTVEKSRQSNAALLAQVPLMVALMLTVLMFQLGTFSRLALVISVAPLGLIGVVAALLTTGTPMGFIAILGVVALAGMIIRNSVILIDQIEHERARGVDPWEAVIDATKHRFRPIMLTAAAAILGMIPIMHDVFWGPMAYAIVGGLAVATALTLVFLPALYVAVNRIREKAEPAAVPDVAPACLARQH
jgi:multidrug efflux pump subunit AcrB